LFSSGRDHFIYASQGHRLRGRRPPAASEADRLVVVQTIVYGIGRGGSPSAEGQATTNKAILRAASQASMLVRLRTSRPPLPFRQQGKGRGLPEDNGREAGARNMRRRKTPFAA